MTRTIDATGLSEKALEAVRALAVSLREKAPDRSDLGLGPGSAPAGETAEEWIKRLRAWAESHPKRDIEIDDDRGSIYDRSCE